LGLDLGPPLTHGLRRGLHSDAALRLKSDVAHCGETPKETVKLLIGGKYFSIIASGTDCLYIALDMKWQDIKLRLKPSPTARKRVGIAAIVLVVAYLAFGSYIWWAMNQPPETFGRVMAKMPGPVPFLLFPFETFWMRARAGNLQIGDAAPDFSLLKLDKTERVQLSALNKQQPVVLVFGSYT